MQRGIPRVNPSLTNSRWQKREMRDEIILLLHMKNVRALRNGVMVKRKRTIFVESRALNYSRNQNKD